MNVLIAPDSFKGTLTAAMAARAMAAGVLRACPHARLQLLPMADGGEGTLEAVLNTCPGALQSCRVRGADGQPRVVDYAVVRMQGDTVAVIEVARVVGLGQLPAPPPAVAQRNTLGVGELLRQAMDAGQRRFLIGLGGSSTNDGGVGLLAALGVVLRDARGKAVKPGLQGLAALSQLDFSALDARVRHCDIQLLADVRNPLCGAQGATAVYGSQKGVAAQDVSRFDGWMQRYAGLGDAWAGEPVSCWPGSGAAGGLGYALQLLGARYHSGAEYLCGLLQVERALQQADLLITGEGRSDMQTLQGKAPAVLARHARAAGVPALLVSGSVEAVAQPALSRLFAECVALDAIAGLPQAMQHPQRMLEQACHDLLRKRMAC